MQIFRQTLIQGLVLGSLLFWAGANGQSFLDVEITTTPVSEGIYMLSGRGGNIGVSIGPDGVLLIDDEYAPLHGKVIAAIGALTDQPVKMVLNTHWHGDHTGGNQPMAESGALIIAHDNVRVRMSAEHVSSFFRSTTPPSPAVALPIITYDNALSLHVNGQTIVARHVPPAHTDGDSVVWFTEANVVHLGDLFFNGFFPFIDVDSGGSVSGMIAAIDQQLELVDADTRIMPGHGPLADREALVAYRKMLATVAQRVEFGLDKGRTRDEIIAARPAAEFAAAWGGGFIKTDQWVGLIVDVIQARQ